MSSSLTLKQTKFIANIMSGLNGTQAALDAYCTSSLNTAAVIAHDNLRLPKVRDALHDNLDSSGLLEQAVLRLSEALEANKQSHNGVISPDHEIRLNAATKAINLYLVSDGQKPLL